MIERELLDELNKMDEENHPNAYRAKLVSVLMYQRRKYSEEVIESKFGPIQAEHRMSCVFGEPEVAQSKIRWLHVPKVGSLNDTSVAFSLSILGDTVPEEKVMKAEELLEHLKFLEAELFQRSYMSFVQDAVHTIIHQTVQVVEKRIDWLHQISSP